MLEDKVIREGTYAFDPERRTLARRYGAARRKWLVLHEVLILGYLSLWLLLPLARSLEDAILRFSPSLYVRTALSLGLVLVGLTLIDTVVGVLQHRVDRRFGQSHQDWEAWATDMVKVLLLEGGVALIAFEGIVFLIAHAVPFWWFWAAVVAALFFFLLMVIAPVLIAPWFYSFEKLEEGEVRTRLLQLAKRAGVPVVDVYRFDLSSRTGAANAAILGMGHTRRVVVGDTLLDRFSPEEIEGILAHELAHHVHRDILWSFFMEAVFLLLGFRVLAWVLQWPPAAAIPVGSPRFIAVVLLVFFLLQRGMALLHNMWSRNRELLADMFAVHVMEEGHAYARALARLGDQNLIELHPPRWYVWLYGTHPPLGERITYALAWAEMVQAESDTVPGAGNASSASAQISNHEGGKNS